MLLNSKEITQAFSIITNQNKEDNSQKPETHTSVGDNSSFIDNDNVITQSIGGLIQRQNIHYYSYANFNLVRLISFLLKQTGPAHVFMTSYSFSQKSIESIQGKIKSGQMLSFKVIVDNRVRSLSPKPFQMLSQSFDYRCTSIHAKVALIWNSVWKISVVTSQNATDNPKMERGIIFTDPLVFNFDLNALTNAYNSGTL